MLVAVQCKLLLSKFTVFLMYYVLRVMVSVRDQSLMLLFSLRNEIKTCGRLQAALDARQYLRPADKTNEPR